LDKLGIDFVDANDIDSIRCNAYNYFHKNTKTIVGDITKKETKEKILNAVENIDIYFLLATTPCQGISNPSKNRKDDYLY